MAYKSLNDLYVKSDVKYLTNSLGEQADDVVVPEMPYEWYDTLGDDSSALLYLVSVNRECGIMAIYEFDDTSRKESNLSEADMKVWLMQKAEELGEADELQKYDVYLGEMTGFCDCDEICVRFPFGTPQNEIREALKFLDAKAYEGL